MVVEKEVEVIDEKGNRVIRHVAPEQVLPGDVVLYTISYSNKGSEEATDIVIVNPVPEHLLYSDNSARGVQTRITFSIDGGSQFAAPEALMVSTPDGESRGATAADYTHIRWILKGALPPEASGEVQYKASVK